VNYSHLLVTVQNKKKLRNVCAESVFTTQSTDLAFIGE